MTNFSSIGQYGLNSYGTERYEIEQRKKKTTKQSQSTSKNNSSKKAETTSAQKKETTATNKNQPTSGHKVAEKETLYSISVKYNTTVAELVKLNPQIGPDKTIKVGDIIKLPETNKPITQKTSESEFPRGKWKIESGKGYFSIMSKFNLYKEELQKLNPNINLKDIKANTEFKVPGYTVKSGDSLEKIAKAHGITVKMLRELNPELGKTLIANSVINVPKQPDQNLGLGTYEVEVEEYIVEEKQTHTIQNGENLFRIAQKYKVPVWALMLANNIQNEKNIPAGLELEIPSESDIELLKQTKTKAEKEIKNKPEKSKVVKHTVANNEVLSKIAEKYGIPSWAIAAKNNLENPNKLSKNQVLIIPTKEEVAELKKANAQNKRTAEFKVKKSKITQGTKTKKAEQGTISSNAGVVNHRLRPTDTLQSIAKEYGVNVKDLKAYNDLEEVSSKDKLTKLKNKKLTSIKIVGNLTAVKSVTGVSDDFLEDLMALEKKRTSLYRCDSGKLTIGYGHNTEAHKDTKEYRDRTLKDTEIYSLLARDILEAEDICKKELGSSFNKLSKRQKEALYSLIFNTGNLKGSPKLIKAIKNGNYTEAATQFNQIYGRDKGKKVVMAGLAKRRFVEISSFVDGSNLTNKQLKKVMAKVQDIYNQGYNNIKNRNNRVDYNYYAKRFLGEYIDKGLIKIKS